MAGQNRPSKPVPSPELRKAAAEVVAAKRRLLHALIDLETTAHTEGAWDLRDAAGDMQIGVTRVGIGNTLKKHGLEEKKE